VERTDNLMVLLGTVILMISLVGSALGGQPEGPRPPQPDGVGGFELVTMQQTITGSGQENSETEHGVEANVTNLATFTVTLSWQDEPENRPGLTNQPDTLGVTVASPAGESRNEMKSASEGSVKVEFTFPVTEKTAASKPSKAGMGRWVVTAEVGPCGDQTPAVPDPLGLRTVADNGNAYTLEITYTHFAKAKGA